MKYKHEYHAWIRWLGDVIERESVKPDGEADMALVGECEALLCDMVAAKEGAGIMLTSAELHARLADIKARGHFLSHAPRKARLSARVGRLAACIALAAVLGLGGTAATVSAIAAMRRDDGNTPSVTETTPADTSVNTPEITWEGIRYTALNETAEYDNIEILLAAQALEIPYPTVLPEGVTITEVSVDVTADPATVTYGFSDSALTMSVILNTAADEGALAQGSEAYTAGGMVSYLCETENGYRATVVGNGTVAVVECLSRETVTSVLDGMAQSEPVRMIGMSMDTADGYLFFTEMVHYRYRPHEVIRRLDPKTGEISTPCITEGCSHESPDCPFFGGGMLTGFQLFDDWILINEQYYWDLNNLNNRSTQQARSLYNLKTGEWRKVPAVLRMAHDIIRVGDRLYMVKRSDGLRYADGTVRTYCRVYEYDLNTTDYRVVYEHNDMIELIYGGNTRIYFQQEVGTDEASEREFYSFNPETGEMREEPTLKLKSTAFVYRNRIYQQERVYETGVSTVTANDVTTGETTVILQDYLNGYFYLNEEGIYYIRMDELGRFYETRAKNETAADAARDTAYAEGDSEKASAILKEREKARVKETVELLLPYNMEVWFCDYNGENRVKLCELPSASINAFTVDGDMLYGYATLQDRETGEDLSRDGMGVPIAIDLTTGEMTVLTPSALK